MRGLLSKVFSPRATRDESGFTLAEVTISVFLVSTVAVIFGSVLMSSFQATVDVQAGSEAVDDLRLSVQGIERELRSAECVREPAAAASGSRLRFTTRANAQEYEVVYEITDGALVRTRDGTARTIVTDLLDPTETFTFVETPRRSVEMRFRIDTGSGREPRVLETTIAGRNAWRTC